MWLIIANLFDTTGPSNLPEAPALSSPVLDTTGTFTDEQIKEISQIISNPENRTGLGEMAVYVTDKLSEDQTIEELSNALARKWGVGSDKDGVLLYIAKDDRAIRLEVADSATFGLTDALAGRIIREHSKNFLSDGKDDYFGAVKAIASDVKATFTGHPPVYESTGTDDNSSGFLSILGVVFLIGPVSLGLIVFIISLFLSITPNVRQKRKQRNQSAIGFSAKNGFIAFALVYRFVFFVIGNSGSSGGSSSGGGRSGGSSFGGGGGFSGGGASGRF